MPQLSVGPGDPGDEAVGLDRAKNRPPRASLRPTSAPSHRRRRAPGSWRALGRSPAGEGSNKVVVNPALAGASTTTSRARRQREPSLRRAHVGQRPKHRAKAPDFDAQPRAMRFIGELRSEGPRHERVPRYVSRPRFAQRACEREQHRTLGERHHRACTAHDMTARVHDESVRRQQRFDLLEQEESLPAIRDQARSGRVQMRFASTMAELPSSLTVAKQFSWLKKNLRSGNGERTLRATLL